MKLTQLKVPTMVLAVIALVVGVSSGAVAAKLITGADVKNESLQSEDIQNGTLVTGDLKQNGVNGNRLQKGTVTGDRLKDGTVTSGKIKDGTIGPNDLNAPAFGTNWSIVDRNVIGNGDSDLRTGPTFQIGNTVSTPPLGVGSLGIRTGSGTDKAAFGNQVDFSGDPFTSTDITAVGYSVFTTGENIAAGNGAVNLPGVQFEIVPNLTATPGDVFSSAVFLPPASANLPGWNTVDAVTTGTWFLTGQTGTDVGCTQATECTFDEMMANLDDADGNPPTILTVQFSKGRDFAFSGAVDALIVNDQVFNFEPFGVTASTVTP